MSLEGVETTRPVVRAGVLARELAWFEEQLDHAKTDPHRHAEADMWRALATELRTYLNPTPSSHTQDALAAAGEEQ